MNHPNNSVDSFEHRFICLGCCNPAQREIASSGRVRGEWQFSKFFTQKKHAMSHYNNKASCKATGFGVASVRLEIRESDRQVGGYAGAGPTPDVRHQHPGDVFL